MDSGTVGSQRTHHTARRKLRKRLEALGLPADEIQAQISELQAQQLATRMVARPPIVQTKKGKGQRLRDRLRRRDGNRCLICGGSFSTDDPATVDHIRPRVDGGTDASANLRLAHLSCNGIRGQGQDPGIDGRTGLPHRWRTEVDA